MSEKTVTLPVLGLGRKIADDMPHNRGADTLKFLLIPFVCFWAFGFPDSMGIVSAFSGFSVPAFYILTGYFVLGPDKDVRRIKMKRAIRRTLITFAVMFVCYFAINIALMTADGVEWRAELLRKRTLFNFVVLNLWPFNIGGNIWFIHSLLYAYIFLLLADWWGWLRHYKLIMGLSMLFMVAAGELAAVLNFHILDYAYLPGGAVTRALPYVLLGMLLREKAERLKAVLGWVYLLIFVLGAGLAFGEIYGLSMMDKLVYRGHMVGYGVMAAAACAWAVSRPAMKRTVFSVHGQSYAKRTYALANPLYYGILIVANLTIHRYMGIVTQFIGIAVYVLCMLICALITAVKKSL